MHIRIRHSIATSSPAAYQRAPPGCQRDSTKGCTTEQTWLTTFGPEYSVRDLSDGEAIEYILKMQFDTTNSKSVISMSSIVW